MNVPQLLPTIKTNFYHARFTNNVNPLQGLRRGDCHGPHFKVRPRNDEDLGTSRSRANLP
jgi:hypothetical protein